MPLGGCVYRKSIVDQALSYVTAKSCILQCLSTSTDKSEVSSCFRHYMASLLWGLGCDDADI